MQTAHFRSVATLGHPNVDRENGVIRDVSIITEGPIRGWGMFCDAACLASVKKLAEARGPGGLAVKFNPDTFDHGPGGIAGHFGEFRIEGDQLLANLFVEPAYPARDYLLNLAANQPGSFGLSVDIEYATENKGGQMMCRCAAIDAVTVVDLPAANARGLFGVGKERPLVDAPIQKSQVPTVLAAMRRKPFNVSLLRK